MRIALDGHVVLANAGHLAPYLNDSEVAMDGALPLGMIAEAEFSVTTFHIRPGDTLLMVSDGMLEAMNARGQLFGIDRLRTFVGGAPSASQIADAAQAFGQEDDISVVSILRELAA